MLQLEKMKPPYDHLSQSYQHLLHLVENPNMPREAPDAFVTLFYRENANFLNFRTYESFEAISRFMSSCIFSDNVIVNIEHFKSMYKPLQVRKMYRLCVGERLTEVVDPHKIMWDIFQSKKVTKLKPKLKNKGNSFMFDLNGLTNTDKKFPKQCRVIIAALLDRQQSSYDLEELKILSANLHKHGLKTKQSPFKILQYYLPQLHDAGFCEYPRKQYGMRMM